jgi:phosphoribosyl 1,2-cyclic phosphodiesterase
MKCVRFWGTRGSLPVALTASGVRRKLVAALRCASGRTFAGDDDINAYIDTLGMAIGGSYGGHSSCVEIETGGPDYVLCDLGSGARPFAHQAIARHGPASPQTYHIFMSHVHWDHIMGFPFFGPAYVPGTKIRIHGCHDVLEEAFRLQQSPPCFPVSWEQLGASIEFVKLEPDKPHTVGDLKVTPHLQLHSGDSFGYRFERDGKTVIYSTDSEHKLENRAEAEGFAAFFRDADVVIFDAMYALAEAISVKADWGHSSNIVGVELCQMARAKHLVLFHHEPANNDATLEGLLKEARRFEELTRGDHALKVSAAYDGLEIDL